MSGVFVETILLRERHFSMLARSADSSKVAFDMGAMGDAI